MRTRGCQRRPTYAAKSSSLERSTRSPDHSHCRIASRGPQCRSTVHRHPDVAPATTPAPGNVLAMSTSGQPPLLVTRDERLLDDLLRLAAAAGVSPTSPTTAGGAAGLDGRVRRAGRGRPGRRLASAAPPPGCTWSPRAGGRRAVPPALALGAETCRAAGGRGLAGRAAHRRRRRPRRAGALDDRGGRRVRRCRARPRSPARSAADRRGAGPAVLVDPTRSARGWTGCVGLDDGRRRPLGRAVPAHAAGSASRSLREALPRRGRAGGADLARPGAPGSSTPSRCARCSRPRSAATTWWSSTCRARCDDAGRRGGRRAATGCWSWSEPTVAGVAVRRPGARAGSRPAHAGSRLVVRGRGSAVPTEHVGRVARPAAARRGADQRGLAETSTSGWGRCTPGAARSAAAARGVLDARLRCGPVGMTPARAASSRCRPTCVEAVREQLARERRGADARRWWPGAARPGPAGRGRDRARRPRPAPAGRARRRPARAAAAAARRHRRAGQRCPSGSTSTAARAWS